MCLDKVTKEHAVAKSDITTFKTVKVHSPSRLFPNFYPSKQYYSIYAFTRLLYDNTAKNLSNHATNLGPTIVKPGFCSFRRKKDASSYIVGRRRSDTVVVKCIIPKGTEVAHGMVSITPSAEAKAIVSQRLLVPIAKE